MLASQPLVTIAMPCLNEAAFIEPCLRSVQAQTYSPEKLEILVADGGSTDGTRAILDKIAAEDTRVRILDNPDRIQAAGLNRILQQSRGDVIVRMDVHCEYAHDYVEKCVDVLLEGMGIDARGLDPADRKIVATLQAVRKPVSLAGLAAKTGIAKETILERHEPYLLKLGLVEVTPLGRVAGGAPPLVRRVL